MKSRPACLPQSVKLHLWGRVEKEIRRKSGAWVSSSCSLGSSSPASLSETNDKQAAFFDPVFWKKNNEKFALISPFSDGRAKLRQDHVKSNGAIFCWSCKFKWPNWICKTMMAHLFVQTFKAKATWRFKLRIFFQSLKFRFVLGLISEFFPCDLRPSCSVTQHWHLDIRFEMTRVEALAQ